MDDDRYRRDSHRHNTYRQDLGCSTTSTSSSASRIQLSAKLAALEAEASFAQQQQAVELKELKLRQEGDA